MPRFSRASTNRNAGDRLRCAPGGAPPKRRRDWLSCGCGRHTTLSCCGADMTGDAPGARDNAGRQCTQYARARVKAHRRIEVPAAWQPGRCGRGSTQCALEAAGCAWGERAAYEHCSFSAPRAEEHAEGACVPPVGIRPEKWHNGLSRQAQREPSTKRERQGSSQ